MNAAAPMTLTDVLALLPVILVAAAAVVVMLAIAWRRHHGATLLLTLAGLAVSAASLVAVEPYLPRQTTPLMVMDHYALFFMGLIFITAFAVAWLAHGYLQGRPQHAEEFYLLLLVATLGAVVLVASSHFATFFIGLEILAVSLYALIAYPVRYKRPLEAGVKYLILSGVASAFLLFGMALLYLKLGTMEFARMGALLADSGLLNDPYLLAGLAMIVVGVGFKLSVVPFHMWTPDVYEGAPAPVTGYLATVSKGAMLALLLRYFVESELYRYGTVWMVLSAIAIASMLAGNLLALLQDNLKRLLAYSSIAHMGYVLVAFLASGALAVEAVSYYLVGYFVMTLGAFGVITILSRPGERDAEMLEDYRGLFWQRPWLAGAFTVMLLSLAGIPLTVGFIAKFYVLAAGVDAALWTLVIVLIAGSIIGLFYYLRVIVVMYATAPETVPSTHTFHAPPASLSATLVLAALAGLLVWLGVFPAGLIEVIQTTAVRVLV